MEVLTASLIEFGKTSIMAVEEANERRVDDSMHVHDAHDEIMDEEEDDATDDATGSMICLPPFLTMEIIFCSIIIIIIVVVLLLQFVPTRRLKVIIAMCRTFDRVESVSRYFLLGFLFNDNIMIVRTMMILSLQFFFGTKAES